MSSNRSILSGIMLLREIQRLRPNLEVERSKHLAMELMAETDPRHATMSLDDFSEQIIEPFLIKKERGNTHGNKTEKETRV